MNGQEQLASALGRDVPRETIERLEQLAQAIITENQRQNLIAPGSIGGMWQRHILDSAQLLAHQPDERASWLDVGSGAGLPGLVIALLADVPVTLVEPRKLRAEFLGRMIERFGLHCRVSLEARRVEAVDGRFDTITARAFAPLERIFAVCRRLSHSGTVWVLPRGRGGKSELAQARRSWQGAFRIESSITDPDSTILVAREVQPRKP